MKLYMHPASPNCVSVLVTANLLGIPLEAEFVDITQGAQHDGGYLALNANALVPTLCDGDFVLWESNAINQYLADRGSDQTLWPKDMRMRADIARWQFWSVAHWQPALQPFLWENLFKRLSGGGAPDPEVINRALVNLNRFGAVLNGHLASRDYLVGHALTLADISVASYLIYWQAARVPLNAYANIRRWFAAIEELPAWRQAWPKAL